MVWSHHSVHSVAASHALKVIMKCFATRCIFPQAHMYIVQDPLKEDVGSEGAGSKSLHTLCSISLVLMKVLET